MKRQIAEVEQVMREAGCLPEMICMHCGQHWLRHSYHGDFCMTEKPGELKTTYREVDHGKPN